MVEPGLADGRKCAPVVPGRERPSDRSIAAPIAPGTSATARDKQARQACDSTRGKTCNQLPTPRNDTSKPT